MVAIKDKSRRKFIVAAHDYNEAYGGNIVLHYLAHLLAEEGYESYVACNSTFASSKAKVLPWTFGEPFPHALEESTMAIYPEIIPDNPFNAKQVTRWILYKEGVHSSPIAYGKDDLVFQYGLFHTPLNRDAHGILNIRMINGDLLINRRRRRKHLFAHIVRKGAFKKTFELKTRKHPPRSLFLDNECKRGIAHMADVFNDVCLVVCYDSESFWAYAAALCGCTVVIIPTAGKSKKQFWNDFPLLKNGIAYGWWDLPRALLSINLVREGLENIEHENLKSLRAYLEKINQSN